MTKASPGEETPVSTDSSSKSASESGLQQRKREMRARSKHTYQYWADHDKESYRCPDCGRGIGAVDNFDVHHIDENPLNGDSENLVALCKRCHHERHGQTYDPPSLNKWRTRFKSIGNSN